MREEKSGQMIWREFFEYYPDIKEYEGENSALGRSIFYFIGQAGNQDGDQRKLPRQAQSPDEQRDEHTYRQLPQKPEGTQIEQQMHGGCAEREILVDDHARQ